MKALFLTGRVILGSFFIYSGLNHFKSRQALTQYGAAKGLPNPELGVVGSGALMIAGGASVILGVKPKLGTIGLITFLGAVSPVFHDFWNTPDPGAKQNEMIHFMKNLAILGAMLALAGVEEPWPASIR